MFVENAVAKRGAKSKELTIVGGSKPQKRKPRENDWTKAKEELFLTALGDTCNVTAAASREMGTEHRAADLAERKPGAALFRRQSRRASRAGT